MLFPAIQLHFSLSPFITQRFPGLPIQFFLDYLLVQLLCFRTTLVYWETGEAAAIRANMDGRHINLFPAIAEVIGAAAREMLLQNGYFCIT